MKSSRLKAALFGAVLMLSPAPVAEGATIIANTAPQNGGAAAGQGSTLLLGAGFLSPIVPTTLTSVDVLVEPTGGAALLLLDLWSDSGGAPGALISSLGAPAFMPPGQGTATFTPPAGIALTATTSYFLVMTCPTCVPPVNNNWSGSPIAAPVGMPGAALLGGVLFSSNGGASWGSVQGRSMIFSVNGDVSTTPVPEPATLILLGLGVTTAGVRRMRKRA